MSITCQNVNSASRTQRVAIFANLDSKDALIPPGTLENVLSLHRNSLCFRVRINMQIDGVLKSKNVQIIRSLITDEHQRKSLDEFKEKIA